MTDSFKVIQNSEEAQANYRRLISAIIDAGFGINLMTTTSVTEKSMDYNFMPIDVESPNNSERRHLFTVVYQPVDNLFYFTSPRDISMVFGEKQIVDTRHDRLKDYFIQFQALMYPSLSLVFNEKSLSQ